MTMNASWEYDDTGNCVELLVSESHDRYRGNIRQTGHEEVTYSATEFEVVSRRDAGTGTRLMMGAIALAKAHGVTRSGAHATAPRTLHISRKLFGEHIVLHDINDVPLDCSVDDALALLQAEQSIPGGGNGIVVYVDLNRIDTSAMAHAL